MSAWRGGHGCRQHLGHPGAACDRCILITAPAQLGLVNTPASPLNRNRRGKSRNGRGGEGRGAEERDRAAGGWAATTRLRMNALERGDEFYLFLRCYFSSGAPITPSKTNATLW